MLSSKPTVFTLKLSFSVPPIHFLQIFSDSFENLSSSQNSVTGNRTPATAVKARDPSHWTMTDSVQLGV
ncbi:hypothetical protein HMI54_001586 [Coelomomyces lativittatus]|nr:hypothetical protein HMI54_001586 [Coelomomyces lativittatus]